MLYRVSIEITGTRQGLFNRVNAKNSIDAVDRFLRQRSNWAARSPGTKIYVWEEINVGKKPSFIYETFTAIKEIS